MAQANPDVGLVQKAAKGNRRAFTTLFNRYFQSVYNYALMLCRDPSLAEDLTQEAFIRAHNNLDRFGPPWNFRTWIFRLTHNHFIDLTRKERDVDPLEEGDRVISKDLGPELETQRGETADQVHNTLGGLLPGHREILVLRELHGFSYAEIGQILDISLSNVKVMIHRARGAFQEAYGTQLLIEDPAGECQEVAGLLHVLHDQEVTYDQERLVKEHLKVCEACQKRRDALIAQSMAFGALVPLVPPKGLADRILKQTTGGTGLGPPQSPGKGMGKILGYGGAAAALGAGAWFLISLFGGGFFPDPGAPEPSPEVLAPNPPPQDPLPPIDPSPSPETMYSMSGGCEIFEDLDISVILLSLPEETMILPLYFKIEGGVPCLSLESPDVSEACPYEAKLGDKVANSCGLQGGFEDRLYCMFSMDPEDPGLGLDLELKFNDCPELVYSQSMVAIPEVIPAVVEKEESGLKCSKDLNRANCIKAGGKMSTGATTGPICICP
jgi:RNA polymerase sigma-70 factor (ECF subfamily)